MKQRPPARDAATATQTSPANAPRATAAAHAFPWTKLPIIAPPLVERVLASSGQPLEPATRAKYEARLGSSLASVRVHRDSVAQASARSVDAAAYTVGNHVVLANEPSEHTLAHELAHVAQQPSFTVGSVIPLGDVDSPSELAADRAAMRMLGGLHATPGSRTSLHLARKPAAKQERTDDHDPGPRHVYLLYVDRPLNREELIRELLLQVFGVTDRTKQDAVVGKIVAELVEDPKAPAITAEKIARTHYQKVNVDAEIWTILQLDVGSIIIRNAVAEDSPDLERAIADLHRYIPGGFVAAKKADLAAYRRIAKKLGTLSQQELDDFRRIGTPSDDLKAFEASVDAFIAAGGKRVPPDLAAPSDHKLRAKRAELASLLGGGRGVLRADDERQVDRLIALARKLSSDQRNALRGGIGITDADALEAALTAVTDAGDTKAAGRLQGGGGKEGTGGAGASKATGGPPGVGVSDRDQLKADLTATWQGITPDKWQSLDRTGRLQLAREIAARQRNLQLKYTATHPGELVTGMVTAPFKIQEAGNEFWKGVGDVVRGHSTWQRIAGFLGGTRATSSWIASVLTALALVAWILNPESAMIRLLMSRAIAMMIATSALTMLEAEARVQQAASAPSFDEFMTGTEAAGSAQAQFYSQMAMMALPLAAEILSKVPVVGRVMPVLRGAQELGGKGILAARARIITALEGITQWATRASATEAAPMAALAAKIRNMTPEAFAKALSTDSVLRDRLGFDAKSGPLIEQLGKSPDGKQVLGQVRTETARVVEDSATLARNQIDDYTTDIDVVIAKLEGATTEAEAQKIIDDAVADLGESASARDFKQRADDYASARSDEATAKARADADAAEQAEGERRAGSPDTTPAAPTDAPLQDVKPADQPEVAKAEAGGKRIDRLDWDSASKLDLDHVPDDVKAAGLEELWNEWAKYVRERVKANAAGTRARTPLKWEAYRDFLGKFARGRAFQRSFTAELRAEVGPGKTVEMDAGVVSDELEAKVAAGEEGVKFVDQIVWDTEAAAKFARGEGPAPEVDTFSNKSRDFATLRKNNQLEEVVGEDVDEVLAKYSGRVSVRRAGPLRGVKVIVKEATLVYDKSLVPAEARAEIQTAFDQKSNGRVTLRFE